MKFNVNGSVKGKPGPSRIGGVLRDELGVVKGIFSKAVGVMDSNQVELLVILKALLVSVESNFFTSLSLIIESDSSNAVSWVTCALDVPWRLKTIFNKINVVKRKFQKIMFHKIPREANFITDGLTKLGVDRERALLTNF